MIYCKIRSCENFKGVQNSKVHMFGIPTDPEVRKVWDKALEGVDCGSSQYLCINHFTSDSYTIFKSGQFSLKTGAVPTLFDIFLIEVDEIESLDCNVEIDELYAIRCENAKLHQQIKQMASKLESEKLMTSARINCLKGKIQSQSMKIRSLKQQLTYFKGTVEQLRKAVTDMKEGNLSVNFEVVKQKEIIECLIHGVLNREKYPEIVRQFCLTMHFHSPRAYVFLRDTFDKKLPHPGTIRSWYANSDMHTEPNIINAHCLDILKRKVSEKNADGEKLIVSLMFDEMHIRKHVQWSKKERKLIGFANIEPNVHGEAALADESVSDTKQSKSDIANQALVYLVNAVNDSFQLPIVYYFINSMNAVEKKNITKKIIEALIDCGVFVSNVSCDAFFANKKMFKLFGADLEVYSPSFKPYIEVKDQRIFIFFDSCHMLKLIRNKLASKGVLFDGKGNEIKWQYFVDLVNMKDRGFYLMHKMNQMHINWTRRKMKVDLAAQTLSESTAASMELLMNKGIQEFIGAEGTIDFSRRCNKLFDVFNSKTDKSENPFKMTLSTKNAAEIFHFCGTTMEYIKELEVLNKDGKKIKVCNSLIRTGFCGFIIDMVSLMMLFQELVEERELIKSIRTYCFTQDPVEIFFGKIRSLCGFNDNPTWEQFVAAFRKLLAYSTIMYSTLSNCHAAEDSVLNPYSNILNISSRRAPAIKPNEQDLLDVGMEEIDEFYIKLSEIKRKNDNQADLNDYTIKYIATSIENRIKTTKNFTCLLCKQVFRENCCENENVCDSTFNICKQTDRFLKPELLKGTINFNIIYHEILENIDFNSLYRNTDFTEHFDHKIYLVRFIVDEFIRIKGTYIAKTVTFKEHENILRVRLHKLLHYLGQ